MFDTIGLILMESKGLRRFVDTTASLTHVSTTKGLQLFTSRPMDVQIGKGGGTHSDYALQELLRRRTSIRNPLVKGIVRASPAPREKGNASKILDASRGPRVPMFTRNLRKANEVGIGTQADEEAQPPCPKERSRAHRIEVGNHFIIVHDK